MPNRVETVCAYQTTRSFGSRENLLARTKEANEAYRELSMPEIAEVVQRSLTGGDDFVAALVSLTCLQPAV